MNAKFPELIHTSNHKGVTKGGFRLSLGRELPAVIPIRS